MFTLYTAPGTVAFATHVTLIECGAEYELARVNFRETEQRSESYRAINPLGRVPTLKTPHGLLTETPAILSFLAQSFPDRALAPTDTFAFARMQAFNGFLSSTVHVNHAHKMRGHRWADEETSFADMTRKVPETMTAAARLIEDHWLTDPAFKGPFVMGETFTVADAYLWTVTRWMIGDEVDMAALPGISAHHERIGARASVRQALEEEKG